MSKPLTVCVNCGERTDGGVGVSLPAEVRDEAARAVYLATFREKFPDGVRPYDSHLRSVDAVVEVVAPHLRGDTADVVEFGQAMHETLSRLEKAEAQAKHDREYANSAVAEFNRLCRVLNEVKPERDALSRMLRAMARQKVALQRHASYQGRRLPELAAEVQEWKDSTNDALEHIERLQDEGGFHDAVLQEASALVGAEAFGWRRKLVKQRKRRKAAEAKLADMTASDRNGGLRVGQLVRQLELSTVERATLQVRVGNLRNTLRKLDRNITNASAFDLRNDIRESLAADDRAAAGEANPTIPPKVEETLNSSLSSAELCRRNGWTVGTRLVGADQLFPATIEITGLGENCVLAKRVSPKPYHEIIWQLTHREWFALSADPATEETS